MKNIFIPFIPHNLELIYEGNKTSTIRSPKAASAIGLDIWGHGAITIKDRQFRVECKGLLSVDECGGRDYVWKTEGFEYTGGPMYNQTKRWLNGIGKLVYYEINRI